MLGLLFLGAPQGKALFEKRCEACQTWERLVDGVVPQGVDVLEQFITEIDLKQ